MAAAQGVCVCVCVSPDTKSTTLETACREIDPRAQQTPTVTPPFIVYIFLLSFPLIHPLPPDGWMDARQHDTHT